MYHHYFSTPSDFPRPFIHISADNHGVTSVNFVKNIIEKEGKNAHIEQCIK